MGHFIKHAGDRWTWKPTSEFDRTEGCKTYSLGVLGRLCGKNVDDQGEFEQNSNGEWEWKAMWVGSAKPIPEPSIVPPQKYVPPSHSAYESWGDYGTGEYPTYGGYGQTPYKKYTYLPYEGFDPKKWPKTFMTLMLLYNSPDWYKGKVVTTSYPEHIGGKHDRTDQATTP